MKLSLLVLTKNEENIVEKNILKITEILKKINVLDEYEIIVPDYSVDSTFKILNSLSEKIQELKPIKVPRRGIGCGLTVGMNNSLYEYMMFYPIDLAWDIKIIEESLKKLDEGYNVVLGSRGLPLSKTKRPLIRKFFSKGYNLIINTLFNLQIKDTQCTIALKKSDYQKYKHKLDDDGAFLQTELLIFSKMNELKIIEIPAVVIDERGDSSVKVISFSFNMLTNAIKKKISLMKNH